MSFQKFSVSVAKQLDKMIKHAGETVPWRTCLWKSWKHCKTACNQVL